MENNMLLSNDQVRNEIKEDVKRYINKTKIKTKQHKMYWKQ